MGRNYMSLSSDRFGFGRGHMTYIQYSIKWTAYYSMIRSYERIQLCECLLVAFQLKCIDNNGISWYLFPSVCRFEAVSNMKFVFVNGTKFEKNCTWIFILRQISEALPIVRRFKWTWRTGQSLFNDRNPKTIERLRMSVHVRKWKNEYTLAHDSK